MMLFLRLLKESVLMAVNALVVNKLRTFLSLLGITIGILAIISVFTVVDSMERSVRQSVESLGDNVVYVQKWPWTFGAGYPWWKYYRRPMPTIDEMEEIKRRSKTAGAVAFMASRGSTVERGSSSLENVSVVMVSHDYDEIKNFELIDGRYFSEFESAGGKNVAIIGYDVAMGLFPEGKSIGKSLKVKGKQLKVIGVFDKEGESMFGNSSDTQILIPVQFGRSMVDIRRERFNPFVMVEAKPGITNQQMIDELTGIMRSLRRLKPLADDNFALNEVSLISANLDSLFSVIGFAGGIIGGFAILVGGFGIANIMFVSVKERTNIIGIQKALGAKNYFILLQFLFEAIFLCLIGGGAGLFIVYVLSLVMSNMMEMDLALTLGNIILGLNISIFIGLIAGIIPAWSASRLDPVEAMRSS